MTAELMVHFFSAYFLCGLIWVVQLVHYPSFRYIDENKFESFEKAHTRNISIIVIPVMLLELITAVLLYMKTDSTIWTVNLYFIFFIWLITALISAPCHKRLLKRRDAKDIELLISTNWLRTVLWTVKALYISTELF